MDIWDEGFWGLGFGAFGLRVWGCIYVGKNKYVHIYIYIRYMRVIGRYVGLKVESFSVYRLKL